MTSPIPLEEAVGHNVKVIREQRRMTQAELAEAATNMGFPITQTGIARIEKGRNLTLDSIWRLAMALNVTPMALAVPDTVTTIDLGGDLGTMDGFWATAWWLGLDPLLPDQSRYEYDRMVPENLLDLRGHTGYEDGSDQRMLNPRRPGPHTVPTRKPRKKGSAS